MKETEKYHSGEKIRHKLSGKKYKVLGHTVTKRSLIAERMSATKKKYISEDDLENYEKVKDYDKCQVKDCKAEVFEREQEAIDRRLCEEHYKEWNKQKNKVKTHE